MMSKFLSIALISIFCGPYSAAQIAVEPATKPAEEKQEEKQEEKTGEKPAEKPVANLPSDFNKPSYVLCRLGRQVRSLRVSIQDGKCKATYTKQGAEQVVADSSENLTCHTVAARIQKNLVVGEWNCRDLSSVKSSFVDE